MISKYEDSEGNVTVDRREDGPVEVIDEAVVLSNIDGVGPALEHMADAGVERTTALRVMAGPEFHREPKQGALTRVLEFLTSRLRTKNR